MKETLLKIAQEDKGGYYGELARKAIEKITYTYEFSVWIDGKDTGSWTKQAVDLIRQSFASRQILENITEKEFRDLREEIWHKGFELHEIEIVPYCEREVV